MKLFIVSILIVFCNFMSIAQITFEKHEIELKLNVKDLNNIKEIRAKSTCGDVKIDLKENLFSGGCAGVLVREYTATDACGNTASTSQFIHLSDDEAPEFVKIVASDRLPLEVSDLSEVKEPIVFDNHPTKPIITFKDEKLEKLIQRTWTATDLCGNVSTWKQMILVSTLN